MVECDLWKLNHPTYSPNLTSCNFFFWLLVQENGRVRIRDDGRIGRKDREVIQAILKSQLIAFFRGWQRRADEYIKNKANYFEQTFVPRLQFSDISFRNWESGEIMDVLTILHIVNVLCNENQDEINHLFNNFGFIFKNLKAFLCFVDIFLSD
jgi:hypothetical protein